MASSRPKIILFSGDLPPNGSPGQPTSTNYTELSHDFTKKAAKKFDNREESPMYHQAPPSHHPHQAPQKQFPDKFVSFGQAAYAVGSKHMSIAAYSRANMRMAWGVLAGIAVGAVLVNWSSYSENGGKISPTIAHWIGLLGGLYLRAVFCIVVPMVFASMSLSIAEILRIGKGRRIAWRVLGYFLITKVFAACIGLAMGLAFESKFAPLEVKSDVTPGLASLRCGQGANSFVTASASGVVSCEVRTSANANSSLFVMKDTNNVFAKNVDPTTIPSTKFGQAVLLLCNDIIPDNVVRAMVSTNILSIAMFAVIFGAAVCKNYRQNSTGTQHVMDLLRQVNFVCELFAEWLLVMSPIPLCSLVAGAFADGQAAANDSFAMSCVYFIVAYVAAVAIYSGVVLPLFLYATTKINPYAFLSTVIPAQLFAFSSSSSAATIPFTLRCLESSQQVSSSVSRFVVNLGAPLNKDGSAIYLSMSMVFIAKVSNIAIAPSSYPIIILLCIVASIVTLPVPNSAPVTLFSIWTSVQDEAFPAAISYLTGINWLVDRLTTVVNVTGDTVVARIVAHQVEETVMTDSDTAHPDY